MMGQINFNKYKIPDPYIKDDKKYIYDKIRKKDVLFTPEEKVRRNCIFCIKE